VNDDDGDDNSVTIEIRLQIGLSGNWDLLSGKARDFPFATATYLKRSTTFFENLLPYIILGP
jgi:hypothetical protein